MRGKVATTVWSVTSRKWSAEAAVGGAQPERHAHPLMLKTRLGWIVIDQEIFQVNRIGMLRKAEGRSVEFAMVCALIHAAGIIFAMTDRPQAFRVGAVSADK